MKKPFLFLTLLAALVLPHPCGTVAAQTPRSLEQALNAGAEYFRRQIPRNSRIIVLPPEAPTEALGLHVGQAFQTLLVNSGFTVLERDAQGLAAAERELGYHMTGMVSDETALGVGKMLGAELVLAGRMTPESGGYLLEFRAVMVETGRIAGAWSGAGIRRDAVLAGLDPPRRGELLLEFAGALAPSGAERDAFFREIRAALQEHGVPLNLPDSSGAEPSPWRIVVTLNGRERPPSPPANTPLVTGDMGMALYRENRSLRQSRRKNISELDREGFYRRVLEEIRNDRDFFRSLGNEVSGETR